MIKSRNDSNGHCRAAVNPRISSYRSCFFPEQYKCGFLTMRLWILKGVIGKKEIEIQPAKQSREREKGLELRKKSTKIRPRAVIALTSCVCDLWGEKKWPSLRAVRSGPCDLLWWLEHSCHVHTAFQDRSPINTDYKSMVSFGEWLLSWLLRYSNWVTALNG